MRAPDNRLGLILGLPVSAALAVLILGATVTASHAQFRPGGVSIGSRAPAITPTFRNEPRFQRFNNTTPDKIATPDSGKGGGKGTNVSTTEPGGNGPGRRPPKGKRPPGSGPVVVGTGVAAGGVAAGATGPAGAGPTPPGGSPPGQNGGIDIPPPNENRFVKDEVMLEFAGNFPPPGIAQLLARHRLVQLDTQLLTLTNTTLVRARIADRRPVRTALRGLVNEAILRAGQPNYLFRGSQGQTAAQPEAAKVTPALATAAAIPAGGDPAQYALAKLRIGAAHTLARGDKVLVAVIDSGIDLGHPELVGTVAGSFDALGKAEKPHVHGTAIAGAIVAHARLMGVAPAAKILAIRAFGADGTSSEATTMAIVKSVEFAALRQARIINMSFAGPRDPGLARQLAAAKAKGAVLIAATGNFGPKSPPQYPASDPNVIAVSATDADDRMFRASNIGPHVALAAPGVDILLPAPDKDYRLISGTSFSAAYVSGVAALVLQRAPELTPDGVRKVLESTARDLGPAGRDPEYGAGLVDAYQALVAAQSGVTAGVPADASERNVTAR